jgi:hypothetical protein
LRLEEEMDRGADASTVAEEFWKRRDAYVADPREEDFALAKDAAPEMIAALARAKKITLNEAEARRSAWLVDWRGLAPAFRPYLWLHGFAKPAETKDEAARALDVLPEYEPLPVFKPLTFADGDVGRTYWLAGRVDDALPVLKRAAASCVALDFPIEATRAQLFFGQALEAKGDAAGACAAYATVLLRWGAAKGGSKSAKLAAERTAKLDCAHGK